MNNVRRGLPGGRYKPLTDEDILRIHETSLKVFDEIGIQVNSAPARELFMQAGAQVDVVPAYQTVRPDHDTERVRGLLMKGSIHMVTFTSSSTVSNFVKMFQADGDLLQKWMKHVAVACIGPITAKTAEEWNLKVSLVPPAYTIESLAEEIKRFFTSSSG